MKTKGFLLLTSGLAMVLVLASVAAAKHRVKPQAAAATINPANFVSEVDNKFFPLEPGTKFFYEGTTDGLPSSDVTYVTHKTKQILGVKCTVVSDQAFDENGKLVEDTFDWYAQDKDGNVWYFGEDTRELDPDTGAVISTEGTWQAGVNGAQPGIVMEAHPQPHDTYQQEFAAGVAEDMAEVLSLKKSACVIYGCFDNLLLTKEWSPLEPGVVEQKYYAEGIGFILSVTVKGGDDRSELVRITTGGHED